MILCLTLKHSWRKVRRNHWNFEFRPNTRSTKMRLRVFLLVAIASVAAFPFLAGLKAQTPASASLTGQVASKEDGPMEGVLVSAKKTGSSITITVVTDDKGHYSF